MSTATNALLGLALGAGAGFAIWHFKKKDDEKQQPDEGELEPAIAPAVSAPVASAPSAAPPRVAGPCALKLDATGLTLDGERVDVPTAVSRCKANGRGAQIAYASNGPAAVYMELTAALGKAGVPMTVKAP